METQKTEFETLLRQIFFFSQQRRNRFWDQPCLLFSGQRCHIPRKQSRRSLKLITCPPSSAEFKNALVTSTLPHTFYW